MKNIAHNIVGIYGQTGMDYLYFGIQKIRNIINSSYYIPSVYGYEGKNK